MKLFLPLLIFIGFTLSCGPEVAPLIPNPTLQAEIQDLRNEIDDLRGEISEVRKQEPDQKTIVIENPEQVLDGNICDRSPAMQGAILSNLGMSKCSEATELELFRIEVLELSSAKPFKSADFNGLSNLSRLSMEIADPCGQWDNLTFTDSVVAKLPSLGDFNLRLYREKLYPDVASAEDIADAVFVAINEGVRTESDERYSESNQERMEARYRSGGVQVQVYVKADENLYPCRRGVAR